MVEGWTLESTDWLDATRVELYLTRGDEDALVTVRVDVDLPRAAHEPTLVDLVVLDIEGAPLDADHEVGRHVALIEREFWCGRVAGHA